MCPKMDQTTLHTAILIVPDPVFAGYPFMVMDKHTWINLQKYGWTDGQTLIQRCGKHVKSLIAEVDTSS